MRYNSHIIQFYSFEVYNLVAFNIFIELYIQQYCDRHHIWLLWITNTMCLSVLTYTFLCRHMFLFLALPDQMVFMFNPLMNCSMFYKRLHRLTSPPTVFEGSSLCASLPTFVIIQLFGSKPSRLVWSSFSLWFWFCTSPNGRYCWVSFHVLISR